MMTRRQFKDALQWIAVIAVVAAVIWGCEAYR